MTPEFDFEPPEGWTLTLGELGDLGGGYEWEYLAVGISISGEVGVWYGIGCSCNGPSEVMSGEDPAAVGREACLRFINDIREEQYSRYFTGDQKEKFRKEIMRLSRRPRK